MTTEATVDRTPHELIPEGFRAKKFGENFGENVRGNAEDLAAAAQVPVELLSRTEQFGISEQLPDHIPDVSKMEPSSDVGQAFKDSILQRADDLVGGDRSAAYGHPFVNHRRIAGFWNIRLEAKLKEPITPGEVAELMILLKCARLMAGFAEDSLIDIAGYAKCRTVIQDHIEKASNGV